MKANLFRLHKDKVTAWREWAEYLESHVVEVKETLEEENLNWEGCVIFTVHDETYVLLSAHQKEGTEEKVATIRDINERHRAKMRECFVERIENREVLYYFGVQD